MGRSLVFSIIFAGCAAKPPTAGAAPGTPPPGAVEPAKPGERLTADECAAQQGTVVGDIGDGAILKPGYRCPSGAAPLGQIEANPEGPFGVEGSVCCV